MKIEKVASTRKENKNFDNFLLSINKFVLSPVLPLFCGAQSVGSIS